MIAEPNSSKTPRTPQGIAGVRHLIAVASAKGGVGKSTVAVNLAVALAQMNKRVGVVDADLLGPSVPTLLGLSSGDLPEMDEDGIEPAVQHGVKVISMAMLTDDDTPAILRGPMITKYLQIFFGAVRWGELDYLIIDLPPGTGDTQLTLAQQMPLSGAVIVTTPQDVSLNITRRGIRMLERVHVPILGIIENMSGFCCPHCGETTPVFRQGGGARLAADLGVRFFGPIPLTQEVVESGDRGEPILLSAPDSPVSAAYRGVADSLAGECERTARLCLPPFVWQWDDSTTAPPWLPDAVTAGGAANLPVGLRRKDSRTLALLWQDGAEHRIDVRDLRLACECAECVEEMSRRPILDPKKVPADVEPIQITSVGRYAIGIQWTDGHSAGIYSFDILRRVGEMTRPDGDIAV